MPGCIKSPFPSDRGDPGAACCLHVAVVVAHRQGLGRAHASVAQRGEQRSRLRPRPLGRPLRPQGAGRVHALGKVLVARPGRCRALGHEGVVPDSIHDSISPALSAPVSPRCLHVVNLVEWPPTVHTRPPLEGVGFGVGEAEFVADPHQELAVHRVDLQMGSCKGRRRARCRR